MSNLSAALNSLAESTSVIDFYLPFRTSTAQNVVILSASKNPCICLPPNRRNHQGKQTLPSPPASSPSSGPSSSSPSLSTPSSAGGKGHVVETGLSIASVAYGCLLRSLPPRHPHPLRDRDALAILAMLCGFTLNLALWQSTLAQLAPCTLPCLSMPKIAFTWYVLIGSVTTFLPQLPLQPRLHATSRKPRNHPRRPRFCSP